MDQRLTMLSIGVKDLDIATDFYETKFEWQKHKSSNKNAVFFKLNGFMLSLYPVAELSEDDFTTALLLLQEFIKTNKTHNGR